MCKYNCRGDNYHSDSGQRRFIRTLKRKLYICDAVAAGGGVSTDSGGTGGGGGTTLPPVEPHSEL